MYLKNRSLIACLVAAVLMLMAPLAVSAEATTETTLTKEDLDRVLSTLEDEKRREDVIKTLRALRDATEDTGADDGGENVRTATTELFEMIAERSRGLSQSAGRFVEAMTQIPIVVARWAQELTEAEVRERWFEIGWRLLAVLGAGYVTSLVLTWLIRRGLGRRQVAEGLSVVRRTWRLSLRFLLDLAPIALFALAAYGVLTIVDPREETRLVAIALINAAVLTRVVMAISSFLFSPRASGLRLWSLGDESAHYVHQWIRRLSSLTLYGYFGLQAALLLGIDAVVYETLMRLLGLTVLLMLLILIAQNRRTVAQAIGATRAADGDEPAALSSFRRGFAQVWHLVTAVYLVVVYIVWALRIEDGAAYLLKGTLATVAAVAIARLLSHLLDQVFDRGLRIGDDLSSQFPDLEKRLNRYFPVLRKLAKLTVAITLVLVIGNAWGIDTLTWATDGGGRVFFGAILHVLFMLGVALFLWEMASGSIERYLAESDGNGQTRHRSARTKTLLTVARNALMVVLTVVTLLMILAELGLNIGPLLAGAGVVGLAIGFGAQRLVQDVINGAFILFQDLMSVGDVVKLGDKAGVVEALSIRTVRLRDVAGVVHTIPFSSIEAVSNLTRDFSFHVFDLGVAYREDIDEVIALIRKVGEELKKDAEVGALILEPVEVFGLDQFGDSAIVIKGRIKTRPTKQWQVGRAFNRLIKIRFDEHGIEIPFPHQTIYFGEDKQGKAPPMYVQLGGLDGRTVITPAPAND